MNCYLSVNAGCECSVKSAVANISNVHILPEVYDKMGLQGIIQISDDVLKFLIDEYTSEPGVRKLKEILK